MKFVVKAAGDHTQVPIPCRTNTHLKEDLESATNHAEGSWHKEEERGNEFHKVIGERLKLVPDFW